MALTKSEAQAYKDRYAQANAIEIDALRKMTYEEGFRQTLLLMDAARRLGWAEKMRDEESVRETWNKLKDRG